MTESEVPPGTGPDVDLRLEGTGADPIRALVEARARDLAAVVLAARDDLGDGLTELDNSTAGALAEVATRLERLAQAADDRIEASSEVADTVVELARQAELWSSETAARTSQVGHELAMLRQGVETLLGRDGGPAGDLGDQLFGRLDRVEQMVAESVGTTDAMVEPLTALRRLAEESLARSDERHGQVVAALERVDARLAAPGDPGTDESELAGSLRRIEIVTEALADAAEDDAVLPRIEERFDVFTERFEALAARVAGDGQSSTGVAEALNRIEAAVGDLTQRPVGGDGEETATRLGRLEEAAGRLGRLEEAVGRLASGRDDDVERIVTAVEARPDLVVSPDVVAQLAAAIRGPAGGAADGSPVVDQLRVLGDQVEGLRRRIALRARPDSGIDDAAVDAMAAAVASRLGGTDMPRDAAAYSTAPAPATAGRPPPGTPSLAGARASWLAAMAGPAGAEPAPPDPAPTRPNPTAGQPATEGHGAAGEASP